ncbi:serine hydrolase-like protein 2 isoform X1 [Mustela putorius furo]|uniref:Serine hydrolase-like protein 2 isoform X1 n=2 Tax=Mustela putorius furo TaxID=9669 RepID=A0A8U0SBB9_MUSPF|nr:serine hydrolase-like protein 2 isoform X1 [Mustela putorius furo]
MAAKGLLSELKLAVPWGYIAAKVWGSQQAPPVLCLHGWLDNASSFDRLIPLLPKDFCYVAMDFGGHGLSSHYSPGLPYYQENFVSEIRRVVAALKWKHFSIVGHSFGGAVGAMFSSIFPEMVNKLILLDTWPFPLDPKGIERVPTYRRGAIEYVLQVEASQKPRQVASPEEMLQRFMKNNSHVSEESARLLLQRGTTKVATAGALHGFRQQGAVCELHQAAAGPRPAHQVSASLVPPKTLGCQEPPGLPRVRFWVLLLEAGLPLAPGHGGHRQQGQELSQLPLLQGRADTGRLSPARSPGPLLLPGLPTAPTCQLQSPSHCLWPQL